MLQMPINVRYMVMVTIAGELDKNSINCKNDPKICPKKISTKVMT